MKLTTYFITGAFAAGLVAIAAVCASVLSTGVEKSDEVITLTGEKQTVVLPERFNRLSFVGPGDDDIQTDIHIEHFDGIAITESDTASRSTLHAPAQWMRALEVSTLGDTLFVRLNPAMIGTGEASFLSARKVTSEDKWPISVTVPRGKLRGAQARINSLHLKNFHRGFFKTEVNFRLLLTDCTFDSLRCASGEMRELKLSHSTVEYAHIRQPWHSLKVISENASDSIRLMKITGKNTNCPVNLKDARIGTLVWDPQGNAVLNLQLQNPLIIK